MEKYREVELKLERIRNCGGRFETYWRAEGFGWKVETIMYLESNEYFDYVLPCYAFFGVPSDWDKVRITEQDRIVLELGEWR